MCNTIQNPVVSLIGKTNAVNTDVLDKVKEILNGDRLDSYGKPLTSFNRISQDWSVYLFRKGKLLFNVPLILLYESNLA